jgi:uncharacterized protein
LPSNITNNREI